MCYVDVETYVDVVVDDVAAGAMERPWSPATTVAEPTFAGDTHLEGEDRPQLTLEEGIF